MALSVLARLASRMNFGRLKGWPIKGYKLEAVEGVNTIQPVQPNVRPDGKTPVYFLTSEPGPVGYPFIPSPGISRDSTSAINASMLKEVGDIAEGAKVSFISNIDPQDLGFMYLGIESVLLCYNTGVRAYAYYRDFNRTNLYKVKGNYKAMHLDYEDWLHNIPNLLTKLNWYKGLLDKLYLPKKFEALSDHFELTGSIYKDSELDKSNDIILYPKGYWKYDPTVPRMQWIEVDGRDHDLTFNEWCDIMDDLIAALIGDEDVTNLASYTRKAYGEGNCYSVNSLDWGKFSETKYDLNVIKALHNACFLNYSSVANMDITQVVTENVQFSIQWDPVFTVPSLGCNAKRLLDINSNDPSEEEVYEASKFMFTVVVQTASGNGGTIKLGQSSTIVLCNPHMIVFDLNMDLREIPLYTEIIPTAINGVPSAGKNMVGWVAPDTNGQVDAFNSMLMMSRYHAAPITYVLMIESNAAPAPLRNKLVVYNALNLRYNWNYVEDTVLDNILEARIATGWNFTK